MTKNGDESRALQGLNPLQRQAVLEGGGPCLVVATVGSGKTRVLTRRLAWLLDHEGADPGRVLALTFTNRAVREMKSRISALLGPESWRIRYFGTFHAVCRKLLNEELPLERYGFSRGFSVYDEEERFRLIESLLDQVVPARQAGASRLRLVKSMTGSLARLKVEPFAAAFRIPREGESRPAGDAEQRLFDLYRQRLAASNALDFDDLILLPLRMLMDDASLRKTMRHRFDHILVDEFQDTDTLQYLLLKGFLNPGKNLFAVGDPCQSIYTWRGAYPEIFDRFLEEYPETRIMHLSQNYRSTAVILQAAARLMESGESKLTSGLEELWTENEKGQPLTVRACLDDVDQAMFVAGEITRLHNDEGIPYHEMAVLYRINALAPPVEAAFRRRNVPCRVVTRKKLLDLPPVRTLIALFKTLVNPDDETSLLRAASMPAWRLSPLMMKRLLKTGAADGLGFSDILRSLDDLEGLEPRCRRAAAKLSDALTDLRAEITVRPPEEVFDLAVERSGILEREIPVHTSEGQALWTRVLVLRELACRQTGLEPWDAFDQWVAELSLTSGVENLGTGIDDNAVTLMTLHAAKGLEFSVVFMIGMNEGLLPLFNKAEETPEMREERRLCFVGITRAKRYLYLTHLERPRRRGVSPWPSRFLEAIPKSLIGTTVGQPASSSFGDDGVESEPAGGRSCEPEVGVRVRHPRLGDGTVVLAAGGRVTIRFDSGRERELLLAFSPELKVL